MELTSAQKMRLRALELSVDATKAEAMFNDGQVNGQTIIRRAVGFYEFLSGNINKKKDNDGLTSP